MKLTITIRNSIKKAIMLLCALSCSATYYQLSWSAPAPSAETAALVKAHINDFANEMVHKVEQALEELTADLQESFDIESREKLSVTAAKIRTKIDLIKQLVIIPLREEIMSIDPELKDTDYHKILILLDQFVQTVEQQFNKVDAAIKRIYAQRMTTPQMGRLLQPILLELTSDANFKRYDTYLAQLQELTKPYNQEIYDALVTLRTEFKQAKIAYDSSELQGTQILSILRKRR